MFIPYAFPLILALLAPFLIQLVYGRRLPQTACWLISIALCYLLFFAAMRLRVLQLILMHKTTTTTAHTALPRSPRCLSRSPTTCCSPHSLSLYKNGDVVKRCYLHDIIGMNSLQTSQPSTSQPRKVGFFHASNCRRERKTTKMRDKITGNSQKKELKYTKLNKENPHE